MKDKSQDKLQFDTEDVVQRFKESTRFGEVHYTIKERPSGPYLIFEILNPTERFYGIARSIAESLPDDHSFRGRITLKKRAKSPTNRINLPETLLLKTVIAECLTASSSTFGEEYLSRYIRSVSGAEEQITANSNHIVVGRRGSGKSSLLLYAMHHLRNERIPHTWTSIQTYEGRHDFEAVIDIFIDVLSQLQQSESGALAPDLGAIIEKLDAMMSAKNNEKAFDILVPRIKRAIAPISKSAGRIVIFLDDIHLLHANTQSLLLSKFYSISRDNSIFLKISGIEQLTKNWDSKSRKGLETPHDAQFIKLDYNLTMPGKSLIHIQSILDAHAKYCGLPSIIYICGDEVIKRLVWVAAGVPRDALSIFLSAASRAALKDQKKVSITSINEAASVTAETKLNDMAIDASERRTKIEEAFEVVRKFCMTTEKKNAFLVEIGANSKAMNLFKEFIGLRLLHILHEGVTPHEAGRRYMGLMLDYGFYVGIRAARSVDVFQKEPDQIAAKDLRNLPIFPFSLISQYL